MLTPYQSTPVRYIRGLVFGPSKDMSDSNHISPKNGLPSPPPPPNLPNCLVAKKIRLGPTRWPMSAPPHSGRENVAPRSAPKWWTCWAFRGARRALGHLESRERGREGGPSPTQNLPLEKTKLVSQLFWGVTWAICL